MSSNGSDPDEPGTGFDRLAGCYRLLEVLAFGTDLQKARFRFIDRLAASTDILLLGDGDGRGVRKVADLAPAARIRSVDSSPAMIARARRRIQRTPAESRVDFICADALAYDFGAGGYSAVTTLFFLDCFDAPTVTRLAKRIAGGLRPGGIWLCADFALPPSGWARIRAKAWLTVLYGFFRWQTGLKTGHLAPFEEILLSTGLCLEESAQYQAGLLRTLVFRKPA